MTNHTCRLCGGPRPGTADGLCAACGALASILDPLAEVAEHGSGADIAEVVYAILAEHGRPVGGDA